MDKPKLILFDIGGVLIEYDNVFKTASAEQNVPINLIDDSFDKYDREITTGKINPQELWLKCIDENNLRADINYNFLLSWLNDYISIKPTFDLIIKLSDKYEIGLSSNIYKGLVPAMIIQKLIPDILYKYSFLSCDLGMQKPDKEIYQYVLDNTHIATDEILLVDDKIENLLPASEIGWQVYEFKRRFPEDSVSHLVNELL